MSNALYLQAKPQIDQLVDHYVAELNTRTRSVFGHQPLDLTAQPLGNGLLINVFTRLIASVLKALQGAGTPLPVPGTPTPTPAPGAPSPTDLLGAVLAAASSFLSKVLAGIPGAQGTPTAPAGGSLGGLLAVLLQSLLPGLVTGLATALSGILNAPTPALTPTPAPGANTGGFVPY